MYLFIYLFILGGQYSMVCYGMVSAYHVNTQYCIESPLASIAQLY